MANVFNRGYVICRRRTLEIRPLENANFQKLQELPVAAVGPCRFLHRFDLHFEPWRFSPSAESSTGPSARALSTMA
jgi:hypothetical protein